MTLEDKLRDYKEAYARRAKEYAEKKAAQMAKQLAEKKTNRRLYNAALQMISNGIDYAQAISYLSLSESVFFAYHDKYKGKPAPEHD